MKYKFIKKQFFTLLELITSMAIFSVLMAVVIAAYSTAQTSTSMANEKSMTFENAKIAMDLISRDIQSIYYVNQTIPTPFWHWKSTDPSFSGWGIYSNELIAFVSSTKVIANQYCTAAESEVKYQLYYTNDKNNSNAGWIMRSVTGNKTSSNQNNTKWNFEGTANVGFSGDANAFTANEDSSDPYVKLIPYVTILDFKCYRKDGTPLEITPYDDETTSSYNCYSLNSGVTGAFPFSINVSISMLGRNAWKKWINLDGMSFPTDSGDAEAFRLKHQQTFNKTIFIGDRGQ